MNAEDARASFSNFGPSVLLYAPGERFDGLEGGIVSLAPGGGRATRRGTSMAAPHVAGVAAIVMSRVDRPDAERVRELLVEGARRRRAPDWSAELSHGALDALGALDAEGALVVRAGSQFAVDLLGTPQLRLRGTVAGGDLARWRADVRPLAGGSSVEIRSWRAGRVFADWLGGSPLRGGPAGDWEYVVTAESGAGDVRTSRGVFTVDWTPPRVDTLFAVAAWRGAEPRWLVSLVTDEAVSATVEPAPGLTLADPGRTSRLQLETAAFAGAAPTWNVVLRNTTGLERDTTLAGVPVLPAWPAPARLAPVDASTNFLPADVHGRAPSGAVVVWGEGVVGDSTTTLQAWGAVAGRLALLHDTGVAGRALSCADANGDGAHDLLFLDGGVVHWLLSRGAGRFPDSLGAVVRAERGLGFFQLDADAPYEALLSSNDSLFLYDDASAGVPARSQSLVNPSRVGFNVFGADAAVGDLDGDGRIEIACGDAEGALVVFERAASGSYAVEWKGDSDGVYAYDFTALPEGGFVAGRQQTLDVSGDGFATCRYEFRVYGPGPGNSSSAERWSFLAPENELRAGSPAAVSPATSTPYVALVRGADLYLLRGTPGAREPEAHRAGAAGEPPVLADVDGDGSLDLVLRTPSGAQWLRLDEGWRGPHALRAEPLSANAVRLDWAPGDADTVQVRRRQGTAWAVLGRSAISTWLDSTLVAGTTYEYEIEGVRAGSPGGVSNPLGLLSRALPRLLAAAAVAPASLRVRGSNPFGDEALETRRWTLQPELGTRLHPALVTLSSAGREAILLFAPDAPGAQALPCGPAVLYADSVRDDQCGSVRWRRSAGDAGSHL